MPSSSMSNVAPHSIALSRPHVLRGSWSLVNIDPRMRKPVVSAKEYSDRLSRRRLFPSHERVALELRIADEPMALLRPYYYSSDKQMFSPGDYFV